MQTKDSMSEVTPQLEGEWGSPEWASSYHAFYGVMPMAGAEGEGAPAAAEGDAGGEGAEGDAGEGAGSLYDLESVPPEYRSQVENIVKEIQSNVTPKFQEAAEYRSQWEPFEELGLQDYEPEAIQGLLAFAELSEDPEAFQEWWESVGDDMNFFDSDGGEGEPEDEPNGLEDDDEARLTQVKSVLEQMLEDRLGPVEESLTIQQENQLIDEAEQLIDQRVSELHEEFGEFDEEAVFSLAQAHAPDIDALEKGFADYQRIVNGAKSDAINGKSNAPRPGEGQGTPNTSRSLPSTFEEASKMAKERFAASRS